MTEDEIKAARALCENTFCFARSEEAVFLDTMTAALDALEAARRDLAEATARAEVQARQRAEDAGVMARQAGGVIARDARIAALENALDMAASALESRSDEQFRRDCAAKARGVLQAKVGS